MLQSIEMGSQPKQAELLAGLIGEQIALVVPYGHAEFVMLFESGEAIRFGKTTGIKQLARDSVASLVKEAREDADRAAKKLNALNRLASLFVTISEV